jgi:hypothetical protein
MFNREEYWKNRKAGKRGQGSDSVAVPIEDYTPPDNAHLSFDNKGKIVAKNRAYRRQKFSLFPKSSQLRKKNKRKKK